MFPASECTASVVRPIRPQRSAVETLELLRSQSYPWLLESSLRSERDRFSFAGADPYLVARMRGGQAELECRRVARPGLSVGRRLIPGDPLEIARALLPPAPQGSGSVDLPFLGGAVGYLGYELAERFEAHHFSGVDDLGLPDLYLLFVDRFFVQDRRDGHTYVCGLGFADDPRQAEARAEDAVEDLCSRLERAGCSTRSAAARASNTTRAPFAFFDVSAYAKAVDTAKQEIEAGEVYQVCMTHRQERDCDADPWVLYQVLRRLNPAPFASYLELPEVAIIGSSPEQFLRLAPDGRVESRPIKGTRPRSRDQATDLENRSALASSAKDRAENLMIVDLVRNDLGRVCETGSVSVPELMTIESYASVHQMVSEVRGRLRPDRDVFDLVRATFPPGSMTGAPKIAAMRILEALEPVKRGIYSGALGYFDVRGGADLSVVIRTILLRHGRAYLHSGGGIVADSEPEAEWGESLDKAALLEAALDEVCGN